jgi:peptidoglycan LD-endopeptidase CwlK
MINSRDLKDLLPAVAAKASAFKSACLVAGIDILITSTYRDSESQAALYAKGRTALGNNPRPGKPMGDTVTNAQSGTSFHNYRCAFDFVPIIDGKPVWNDDNLFTRCGIIAESVGLEWAGRWRTFKELAHCQYTGGLSITDLKNGKDIK